MDNFYQLLIYLLFFAIYGVSRLMKERRKKQASHTQPDENPNQVPRPDNRPSQPKSFEDIIRELMGDHPQERQQEMPPPVQQQKRAKEVRRKKEQQVQSEAYNTGSDTYQRAVDQAKHMEKLDDRIDLERLDEIIKPVKTVSTAGLSKSKKKFINDIRKSLQSPDRAKRAVILSEILNRKYF